MLNPPMCQAYPGLLTVKVVAVEDTILNVPLFAARGTL